jgi:hypothetical protein
MTWTSEFKSLIFMFLVKRRESKLTVYSLCSCNSVIKYQKDQTFKGREDPGLYLV